MKDAETIKEIYKEYWRCMIDKDDYSAEHDEIQVKVNGCAAVMTGKAESSPPYTAEEKNTGICEEISHCEKKEISGS